MPATCQLAVEKHGALQKSQRSVKRVAYELGRVDYRIICFRTNRTYDYVSNRQGPGMVAELQRLAVAGHGLNSYISSVVRSNVLVNIESHHFRGSSRYLHLVDQILSLLVERVGRKRHPLPLSP